MRLSQGICAINPLTGFLRECAASFGTTDTGAFGEYRGVNPPPRGQCDVFELLSDWSDFPDSTYVEKGGVAQMTHQGVSASPIWTVGATGLRHLAMPILPPWAGTRY